MLEESWPLTLTTASLAGKSEASKKSEMSVACDIGLPSAARKLISSPSHATAKT